MWVYDSLAQVYRVFCQPGQFRAATEGLTFRARLRLMLRIAPLMLAVAALTVGSLSVTLQIVGLPFHWAPKGFWWRPSLSSVTAGIAVGALWNVAMGVASGTVWGPAQWLVSGVVLPLFPSVSAGAAQAIAVTVPLGLAVGVGLGVAGGTAKANTVWGTSLGAVLGLTVGRASPAAFAVGWLASYFMGYFQIAWYPLDAEATLLQLLRARRDPQRARALLRGSPIYWREPIWLPLVGLRPFLRLIGEHDLEGGVSECLFVISERPNQARAARAGLMDITTTHLARLSSVREIADAVGELERARTAWGRLPGPLTEALPSLEELARYAEQHLTATLPHNRRRALQRLRAGGDDLARKLALERASPAPRLVAVARKWQEVAKARLDEMDKAEAAAGFIHNPFVFGQPIEETDTNLFVGRRDIVQQIEMSLLGGAAKPALVLWGPRRMGKTSVLLQLPRLLGSEFVPAFVDMQAMQVRESLPAFFRALTSAAAAALRRRGGDAAPLSLSDLREGPFTAFATWIEDFRHKLGPSRRLLLCLDEFERLETSIKEGSLPKELMDQIRHLIQHQPHVVVLVSGSHRPDEMQLNWPDVLISTKLVQVSYLEEEEARQLITQPVPDFPLDYAPEGVESIIHLTRCQPYLVQAVCFELVNLLNIQGRQQAGARDVAEAAQHALDSTHLYFAEMWRQLSDKHKALLRALAQAPDGVPQAELGPVAGLDPDRAKPELQALSLRSIAEQAGDGWRLQVPLVAEWVRTRAG